MKVFTIKDLTVRNRKACYPIISEEIETLLFNLLYLYEELFDMTVDKNGDEMKAEQEKCTQQEGEIKEFLSNLEDRYYELEAEEVSIDEASVPAMDKRMEALEQAMKEQLEDSKRREEEEKRARQEKERITEEIIEAKLHAKLNGLKTEAEFISSLATKVPLSTWKDVEDPKVKQSMGELKDCQDKVDKLKYPDLIAQTAEADITLDNIAG